MSEYERGFTDALKIILLKIGENTNLEALKAEVERLLRETEKARLKPLLDLLD